jgi:hypothetical protein
LLALPGERHKLTPERLTNVYGRNLGAGRVKNLLPAQGWCWAARGGDQGRYVDLDVNGHWWIPSGQTAANPCGCVFCIVPIWCDRGPVAIKGMAKCLPRREDCDLPMRGHRLPPIAQSR